MNNTNKVLGKLGEDIAYNHYVNMGYEILDRNFSIKRGEIDLIAKKDKIVVFVEVKSRRSNTFGAPRESVTIFKQNKIKFISNYYIIKNNLNNFLIRYDIAEVLLNNKYNNYRINILEDAFR